MDNYTLIANSGIHLKTFAININLQDKYKLWFHEWFDDDASEWKLELLHEVKFKSEDSVSDPYLFSKNELRKGGYLPNVGTEYTIQDLEEDGVFPLRRGDKIVDGVKGEIYKMTFTERHATISNFENVWLPAPYFLKKTETKYAYGSFNWVRFKLIPQSEENGTKTYQIVLAVDTHARYESDELEETPVFPDQFKNKIDFELCGNDGLLMDYCSGKTEKTRFIDEYLMHLVHPNIQSISKIRGSNVKKMAYIATYVMLVNYLAQNNIFPKITLAKDKDVNIKNVDMIVDIGNSKTMALLLEDGFNQTQKLRLINYTKLIEGNEDGITAIASENDSFDMRLAFRKVNFGNFGNTGSRQFVYPSFIRLGQEAKDLIHQATIDDNSLETISTYSSPKRYLWDDKPNQEEWRFLTLEGEVDDSVLKIEGLTNQLESDGTINKDGLGGITYKYSRKTLMTFAFLEMLVQAQNQINSEEYREFRGNREMPRKVERIIITCPTAMSKKERETLVNCAKDAVTLLENYENGVTKNNKTEQSVEVIPAFKSYKDDDTYWYYDEATCAQLVYVYGEVGYKYKGACSEFFNLYGKPGADGKANSLTIASLDIGAGTTDLMISEYKYEKTTYTKLIPAPQFYDSYYYAGDDMLSFLINNIMFQSNKSAFRQKLKDLSYDDYLQKMKDFVGPNYNGQSMKDRVMRRDFNIQYSMPVMYKFLDEVSKKSANKIIHYTDVFKEYKPNQSILEYFEDKFGFSLEEIEWEFDYEAVCDLIRKAFNDLLKKVATIMFAHACDIIVLSGRPANLPPIRELLLKYYCISPDRLILLNDYYVGDWFPFGGNEGKVKDSKTIVALGAVIAYYASALSNLPNFRLDTTELNKGLTSIVNYIEASRDGMPVDFFITPEKHRGDIQLSSLPQCLKVRKLGIDSYPARKFYSVDFDKAKIMSKIEEENSAKLSQATLNQMADQKINALRMRMPFTISIEREPDDKETLQIVDIIDKNGDEISKNFIDLHIQSLGVQEKSWLDTGVFEF